MVDVDKRAMNGKRLPEVLIDSALISTIASIVGIVLRVIELGGIQTYWMAASATFAIGIGQLFETEALGADGERGTDASRTEFFLQGRMFPSFSPEEVALSPAESGLATFSRDTLSAGTP